MSANQAKPVTDEQDELIDATIDKLAQSGDLNGGGPLPLAGFRPEEAPPVQVKATRLHGRKVEVRRKTADDHVEYRVDVHITMRPERDGRLFFQWQGVLKSASFDALLGDEQAAHDAAMSWADEVAFADYKGHVALLAAEGAIPGTFEHEFPYQQAAALLLDGGEQNDLITLDVTEYVEDQDNQVGPIKGRFVRGDDEVDVELEQLFPAGGKWFAQFNVEVISR